MLARAVSMSIPRYSTLVVDVLGMQVTDSMSGSSQRYDQMLKKGIYLYDEAT